MIFIQNSSRTRDNGLEDMQEILSDKLEKNVNVLLAVYNGEKYLESQLDSLVNQTYRNYTVNIRDDDSIDNTKAIILDYIRRYPEVFTQIEIKSDFQGAAGNFGALLSNSRADYIMCCDQDDIWLPQKIESAVKYLEFYESVFGDETPLLLHTNLKVVNEKLNVIDDSFWRYQKLNHHWGEAFNLILTQNVVTGCAMIVNRALLDRALPIPREAVMHDWWLALVACAFGKIVAVDEANILYRQHESNTVGAKRFDKKYILIKAWKFLNKEELADRLLDSSRQAGYFAGRYPKHACSDLAFQFSQIPSQNAVEKRYNILCNKFWKVGLIRNIGWLLRI